MKRKRSGRKKNSRGAVFITIILFFFCVLTGVVYVVDKRISDKMSESAIVNLSESLDLLKNMMETILYQEAEFQKMLAQEIALLDEPEDFIQSDHRNETMVRLSLVKSGKTKGISSTGEEFSAAELDFTAGEEINGLQVSNTYLNSMGTWAYTMKCPVVKDGRETAALYVEYIYDTFDEALPDKLYNGSALLYIMDTKSERFVLKPKGFGEREAGSVGLYDFFYANKILEEDIQNEIEQGIHSGIHLMFYHKVRNKDSLIYMWPVNNASIYMIGYVPIKAIQKEGDAVNQNILIVIFVVLGAFAVCCTLYYLTQKQQSKVRKEREKERETYNQQLKEALQAAQIASKSKTMFLSNMSHDIRTPMNAILGFTVLLAKDAENPDKVREYTKKITSSGRHLLSLINDVLDVSKIESGKVVLSLGAFTLSSMVSSVDAIIRPMAKARKQKFDIIVEGIRHECLIGDETRLNQILINLLSNSVKYTQEGGNIWLRLTGLKQRSPQFEHIRIEVEDNGYGMTPEYLEVVFDAFTRAENSTTNKVQGTGLGMAITKNIVELMGGTIEAASEVDKGTTFTVELELRLQEETADSQFWQTAGIQRILVVDDDKDTCKNINMLMKDEGIVSDLASSGQEALARIQEACGQGNPYDVILLNWKLPGMDGIETAKKICRDKGEKGPILFLAAYDWEEIQEEASAAGIDGFLSKPFFISAFKEQIQKVHGEKSRQEQAENNVSDVLDGRYFLIAEDNEINSEILLELLHLDGADGEVAENGLLAVEIFTKAAPGYFDAVLMDVQMPVMNGYEATRKIRALEREDAKKIPIIAMTANAFAEDVKDARDAGMDDHIAKPIDMETIRKTLSEYL